MLTIDLDPELETALNALAQRGQVSSSEIIRRLISHYIKEQQESELLIDVIKDLPEFPSFANKDALEIQKAMRDEWD